AAPSASSSGSCPSSGECCPIAPSLRGVLCVLQLRDHLVEHRVSTPAKRIGQSQWCVAHGRGHTDLLLKGGFLLRREPKQVGRGPQGLAHSIHGHPPISDVVHIFEIGKVTRASDGKAEGGDTDARSFRVTAWQATEALQAE